VDLVEVVIPYLGGCQHREAALSWVLERHVYPVKVALGSSPWCKAKAVMPAVENCPAGAVVVADADVWCDGLRDAVQAVQEGALWARPYARVHRLTKEGTAAVVRGEPWREQPLEERPYRGVLTGGMLVAQRDVLLRVPMDPRFVGYGQEDEAWGAALATLAGRPWRGRADLVHLWHPPQKRMSRRKGSPESWELYKRYMEARRDPALMRRLIEEFHDADEHAVHDPSTAGVR
jgi:hypothetical protein